MALLCLAVVLSVASRSPIWSDFQAVRHQNAQGSHEVLLDRDGRVLEHWRRPGMAGWQAPWRSLEAFPKALVEAVIVSEDQRFFEHSGVDLLALAASAMQSLEQRRGGSTITMQTARLLLGRDALPQTLWGKLLQIDAAWALERRWSKAQILEAYLNLAPLRSGVRGFHSGQALWLASLGEAEQQRAWPLLVAMLPAPQARPEMLGRRSCAVQRRLAQQAPSAQRSCQDFSAADWALWETVWTQIFKPNHDLASIDTAQSAIYLIANDLPAPLRSTVQARLQATLIGHLREGLQRMRIGDVNAGAAVLIDNASGEVLAFGSVQAPSFEAGGTPSAAVQSTPGLQGIHAKKTLASTLKPFLYAQALDAGLLHPHEIIRIRDRVFSQGSCDARPYRPRDSVALYQSQLKPALGLAASSNIAAVDILQRLLPERFEMQLSALQVLPPPAVASAACQPLPRYGHALALGAAQGSLLALTNAYRSLANAGLYSPTRLWMDAAPAPAPAEGSAQRSAQASTPQRLFSAESAAWVSAALSDHKLRFEAFGPRNALDTPYWSASKTGTSDRALDNWAMGYTQQYSLGVWIGNTQGEPMKGVFGPSGAAPIWRAIMDEAMAAQSLQNK
jgi:penicillin-binding protein 1C